MLNNYYIEKLLGLKGINLISIDDFSDSKVIKLKMQVMISHYLHFF